MLNQASLPRQKINIFLKENQGHIQIEQFKAINVNKELYFVVFYEEKDHDKKYVANIIPRGKWKIFHDSISDKKDKSIMVDCFYDKHTQKLSFAVIEDFELDKKIEDSKCGIEITSEMITKANEAILNNEKINESKIREEEARVSTSKEDAIKAFDDFTTDPVVPGVNKAQKFAAGSDKRKSEDKKDLKKDLKKKKK